MSQWELTGVDGAVDVDDEAVISFANRLAEYAEELSHHEAALLRVMLVCTMDPLERARQGLAPGFDASEEELLRRLDDEFLREP